MSGVNIVLMWLSCIVFACVVQRVGREVHCKQHCQTPTVRRASVMDDVPIIRSSTNTDTLSARPVGNDDMNSRELTITERFQDL